MLVLSCANAASERYKASHPTYHSIFSRCLYKAAIHYVMYPSIFFSGPLPISRQDAGEAGAAHLRGHAALSKGALDILLCKGALSL